MSIIILGNPIDGLQFFGPFQSEADAIQCADEYFPDEEWWVHDLEPPIVHVVPESD